MVRQPFRTAGQKWLRRWLRRRRKSQKDLAFEVGASPAAVCQWLVGTTRPGPASRAALARVCNIEPEAWDTQAEQQRLAWVEQQALKVEGGQVQQPGSPGLGPVARRLDTVEDQLTGLEERVTSLSIEFHCLEENADRQNASFHIERTELKDGISALDSAVDQQQANTHDNAKRTTNLEQRVSILERDLAHLVGLFR